MTDVSTTHTADPAQHLMQIAGGYVLSSALYVVTKAGVADHLGSGPRNVAELAKATKTNEDALYRLMRLLATVGIFVEEGSRSFALTAPADLLRKSNPRSMYNLMVFVPDPFHMRAYADLMVSLETGRP